MDLDHIRYLVHANEVRYTDKFDRMLQAREFTVEQAHEVVLRGRLVDVQKVKNHAAKPIVEHLVVRNGVLTTLVVELAVTDVVVFISGYWPADSDRKRK
ncbi:MAG: hypothetical protein ACYCW6_28485 [Candidatus Xenobia bacterium]